MKHIQLYSTLFCLLFCCVSTTASSAHLKINLIKGYGHILKFYEPVASVFVGSNNIAEIQAVDEKTLYVSGLSVGTTNLLIMNYNNDVIRAYTIEVSIPNEESGTILRHMVPRNSIKLNPRGNTVILEGNTATTKEAIGAATARQALEKENRQVIDKTTTSAPVQVALKMRIVELFKRDLLRLGFDFNAIGKGSVFRVVTGTGIAEDFVNGAVDTALGITRAGGTLKSGQVDITGMLDLLESKGIVKILAEPMLTTTTGQKATFRSGGEFAVPVHQGDGRYTNEYKQTGITVEFLPNILPYDRIAIEVSPEIVYVDTRFSDQTAPSLLVRSVDTKVEVASGQTFAIAGLYELFQSKQNGGTPGLAKLPFIGDFFTNSSKSRDERELVFFITPYLVKNSSVVEAKKEPDLLDTVGFIVE